MILEEIEVKDFRSHGHSTLVLDQGITVIIGENGSGKTSLLEAVNFALFKQRPNNVNIDDLVKRGSKTARVAVKFHSGGRAYKVLRERRAGKTTSSSLYIFSDGKESLQAMGEVEVSAEIEGALGMNGDLFTSAVYIKQGEIDALLSAEPAKRKAQIGRLIGAEELEKAYQRMYKLVNSYSIAFEKYRSIPEETEKLEARRKEEAGRVSLLKQKITAASQNLEEEKSALREKEKSMEAIETYCALKKEMKNKESELSNLLDKISRIQEYEEARRATKEAAERYLGQEEELGELREELRRIAELRGREKALEKELANQQEQIRALGSDLKERLHEYCSLLGVGTEAIDALAEAREAAIKALEDQRGEARKKAEEASSRINEIRGASLELEKALAELAQARGRCPTCSKPLTEEHKEKLLSQYSSSLEKNQKNSQAAKKQLDHLLKAEEKLEREAQRLQGINVEVLRAKEKQKTDLKEGARSLLRALREAKEGTSRISELEDRLSAGEKAKASLQDDYNIYVEAIGYLRKNAPEKDAFQDASRALRKEIQTVSKEVKTIASNFEEAPDEETLALARKEVMEKRSRVTAMEAEKSSLESEARVRQENVVNAKSELEELRKKKREGEEIARYTVFLEKVRSLFHKDNLQRELRRRAKPLIEKYTREIFDEFGLPYSDLALSEDFDLKLYGIAGEESADMLSGGERIASALALRLGISKALAGSATELIMLDEPTIHLDAMRRRELVEIIRKLATIPQTIVVTHDKEFEGAADKLLLVEKQAGVSRVVEG